MSTFEEKLKAYETFGSKLGLERMEELLGRLGNPQDELQVIHVAGTNGKGSTCRFISEMLKAGGYRVGEFISPYVVCFNERIQLDDAYIADEELDEYGAPVLAAAKAMVDEGWESPTEFEVITAVGLCYFAAKKPDFVVLEVGLGGRGDSTNVIKKPVATVITGIAYDHMDRLGSTLEEIAAEKAGIIKDGVPLAMRVNDEGARKVILEAAAKHKAPVVDISGTTISRVRMSPFETIFDGHIPEGSAMAGDYPDMRIRNQGRHMAQNALLALSTIEIMRRQGIIKLDERAQNQGLRRAVEPCRFERFEMTHADSYRTSTFILDGAHNAEAMRACVATVFEIFTKGPKLMIMGCLADKDVDALVEEVHTFGPKVVMTVPVDNPRALDHRELAERLTKRGVHAEPYDDIMEAVEVARTELDAVGAGVCLLAGSFYMVSEARRRLLATPGVKQHRRG